MKITEIEVLPVQRYLFVQVHTDAGIVGLGESGAWGYLGASAAAVESFKRYLGARQSRGYCRQPDPCAAGGPRLPGARPRAPSFLPG